MTEPTNADNLQDATFVKVTDAAPLLGSSEYFNHPTEGWVEILEVLTDIEADIVVAAYGDPVTGEFLGLYKSWYPDTEELIAKRSQDFIDDIFRDEANTTEVENADDLVEAISTATLDE